MEAFNVAKAKSRFPALNQDQVFLDNAGGSQVLGSVIDSISKYLSHTNVQLGASYAIGQVSNSRYSEGCKAAARYMNADPDEVVLGASTTQLLRNISLTMKFEPGDEIIVSKIDHETNIKPWVDMAERNGMTLKWWVPASTEDMKLGVHSLTPLLSPRTKFVSCCHVSNILGIIHDIPSIAKAVHSIPGAMLCVDGVSYAPHRQIDVKELDVDFYGFSWYKVYGPHIATLYARRAIQEKLNPLSHFFIPKETLEGKIGLAAANYELTQSIPEIVSYLGGSSPKPVFEAIAAHEGKLQAALLEYLISRGDINIYGEKTTDPAIRVPTISFTVRGMDSREVVEQADQKSHFGFRWGHFYSKRLCSEILGLGDSGVVRISMVHYNTEEEVKLLIETLDSILPPRSTSK
ncbi:PLP-dependent transferase [Glonium stellatum]|uniref:PLP-dependent transferase n=1 Tax=Glonium stellatum TaxID=574774 RepID=A0A8E2JQL5_9PEZI|nr:PLP-dependent transferase [Glonium stellatum]